MFASGCVCAWSCVEPFSIHPVDKSMCVFVASLCLCVSLSVHVHNHCPSRPMSLSLSLSPAPSAHNHPHVSLSVSVCLCVCAPVSTHSRVELIERVRGMFGDIYFERDARSLRQFPASVDNKQTRLRSLSTFIPKTVWTEQGT